MNKILTLFALLISLNLIAQSAQPVAVMTNDQRSFKYQMYNAYTLDNKLVKVVVSVPESDTIQIGEIVNAYYSDKNKTYEQYPTGIHELCIDMEWDVDTLAIPIAVVNGKTLYRIEMPNGRTEILNWDINYGPLYDAESIPVKLEGNGNGMYIHDTESTLFGIVRSKGWIRPMTKIKT
jgi:hypothetical protein